jgi:hypothetical protein
MPHSSIDAAADHTQDPITSLPGGSPPLLTVQGDPHSPTAHPLIGEAVGVHQDGHAKAEAMDF